MDHMLDCSVAEDNKPVVLAHGHSESDCGCGCGGAGSCANSSALPPVPVYALGTIDARFSDPAIEDEANAIAASHKIKGQMGTPNWLHDVLSRPEALYLARQTCFIFAVERQPIYALQARDSADLHSIISCLKSTPDGLDLDLVIGYKGPLLPPEASCGLSLPLLVVEQVIPFTKADVLRRISMPKGSEDSANLLDGVFSRLIQIADNVGATDAHRSLNYLAVRYAPLYRLIVEKQLEGKILSSIEVGVSRLSGNRKIVTPIFTFQSSSTGFIEKFFIRVDATHLFPRVFTHLQPYFDR
jgi:hypothetical protein